ncbi:MAG: nicotinate phosphoribosyltransferase [Deltaproteobacteria bacterium]|nr:nicotinate phosphoribosyltransferase [Deltaproteobacteria bacterium]
MKSGNNTLDTDLYELTMAAGYLSSKAGQKACFDLYYRQNPDGGGFCVFAGLESVIRYVNNLRIYPDDLEYLKNLGIFSKQALANLAEGIRFTGDIWAVPEGTVVFPNEPLVRVTGPIAEAQILETTMLAIVGHQTLIATKAARLKLATRSAPVVDFGTRRAHGVEAALYGARAAYIGGCEGTSNVKAGMLFGIPVRGTHAHSWVESFDQEIDSFRTFYQVFPDDCVFLVDTYDVADGVRNAIRVAEEMRSHGKTLKGIRIDSGDLAYYSKVAREMLDKAGFQEVKILASSDLDEWLIETLRDQGARIDIWCVGTKLMTSYQTPALGVVYKLMAADRGDGKLIPKIKISQNPEKVTNPGVKKIIRFYNMRGRMMGDLLTEANEPVPEAVPVIAHHPMYDYLKKTYKPPYYAKEIMVPIYKEGKQVYDPPPLKEIKNHAEEELESLEEETKRFINPHIYKVSLSNSLHQIKKQLLTSHHFSSNSGK